MSDWMESVFGHQDLMPAIDSQLDLDGLNGALDGENWQKNWQYLKLPDLSAVLF